VLKTTGTTEGERTGALASVDGLLSAGGTAGGIVGAGIASPCLSCEGALRLACRGSGRGVEGGCCGTGAGAETCGGNIGGSGSSGDSTRTDGVSSCVGGDAAGRVNAYTDTPEMSMPRTQTATVRLAVMVSRKSSSGE